MRRTIVSISSGSPGPDASMIIPWLPLPRPIPTLALISWPGRSLCAVASTTGTTDPDSALGRASLRRAWAGATLVTFTRFQSPIPAAINALSKAFSLVSPSAWPTVAQSRSGGAFLKFHPSKSTTPRWPHLDVSRDSYWHSANPRKWCSFRAMVRPRKRLRSDRSSDARAAPPQFRPNPPAHMGATGTQLRV